MILKLELEKAKMLAAAEAKIESIKNVMKNLDLSAEAAMKAAGIPQKEFHKYMTIL